MAKGQPDFVFSDEEDGVVAIKNGDEILYASLYWRARYAVNFLARVHYMTPTLERDATVTQDVIFDDSGMVYKRRDHTIEPHSGRHERKAKQLGLYNALAGEEQPIAKLPDDVLKNFKPGKENIFAGKGQFYTLRYGPYVIAMNMTTNKTFDLTVPQHTGIIKELVSQKTVKTHDKLSVTPRSPM